MPAACSPGLPKAESVNSAGTEFIQPFYMPESQHRYLIASIFLNVPLDLVPFC